MEFRKMVTITLYTKQQKRHWCIEQSFGLCGRGRGWGDLGEWHWNMYNIIYETSRQSKFDARYWMLGAGALGRPRGMVWGGRREEGSWWGAQVYLWWTHFDTWQNQYNIVKLKNKIKKKYKNKLSYIQNTGIWCLTKEHKGKGLAGLTVLGQITILHWISILGMVSKACTFQVFKSMVLRFGNMNWFGIN